MAPDFKSYLATQVIAEKETVSYRNVSRALKVHVNSAKCMLYEFWEKENKKKAGSVYATYIIAGTKRIESKPAVTNGHGKHDNEDVPMPSSPPPFTSSMIDASQQTQQMEETENIPTKTISLVREEDLETVKAQFEAITSIHIYSLSPGRLQDLVVLTDIGRGIYANSFVKEDPLKENKIYGVIQNPGVRRRTAKRPNIPAAPLAKPSAKKEEPATKKETTKPAPVSSIKRQDTNESSRPGSRDSNSSAGSNKQPTLKRDASNLFKAFAKQQNKPKAKRQDTETSNASASGTEDVKMVDADEEGESEDEALFLDTGTRKSGSKKRPSDAKKERDDKQAKLMKMMESDDEDEKATSNAEDTKEPPATKNGADETEAADEEVAWSDSDTEKQKQSAPTKDSEPISTEPKRRRGKRKIMKKRTMKDEDGYLVTKEEAVWESFSEDEPEPAKEKEKPKNAFSSIKSQVTGSQKSSAGAKGGTAKKKGDIMSFFGKK